MKYYEYRQQEAYKKNVKSIEEVLSNYLSDDLMPYKESIADFVTVKYMYESDAQYTLADALNLDNKTISILWWFKECLKGLTIIDIDCFKDWYGEMWVNYYITDNPSVSEEEAWGVLDNIQSFYDMDYYSTIIDRLEYEEIECDDTKTVLFDVNLCD